MASMRGKVTVVTGGASGIGLATSKLLASRGAKVSIADLHPDLEIVGKSIIESTGNPDVLAIKVDVRDVESIKSWIERTVANCEGCASIGPNPCAAR